MTISSLLVLTWVLALKYLVRTSQVVAKYQLGTRLLPKRFSRASRFLNTTSPLVLLIPILSLAPWFTAITPSSESLIVTMLMQASSSQPKCCQNQNVLLSKDMSDQMAKWVLGISLVVCPPSIALHL